MTNEERTGADTLRAAAMSSTRWTAVGAAILTILQTVQLAILARFLAPDDFGLFALIMIPITLAQIFADVGMGAAIIQRQGITHEETSSLYWLNVASGMALFVVVTLAAPVVVLLTNEPRMYYLLPLAALSIAVVPVGQQFQILMQKEIRFARITHFELAGAFAGAGVAIGLALSGMGVLALILGQVVNSGVRSGLLALQGWRTRPPLFRFRYSDVRPHVSFALYLMGERVVNALISRVDQLLVGILVGVNALGFYAVASNLTAQPLQKLTGVVSRVLFPVLARLQTDPARQRDAFVRVVATYTFVGAPILLGLAAVAGTMTPLILGRDWEPAVPLIRILSVCVLLRLVISPTAALLVANGKPDWSFYWSTGWTLLQFPAVGIGALLAGVEGAALGVLFVEVIGVLMNFALVQHQLQLRPAMFIRRVGGPILLAVAMAAVVLLVDLAALRPTMALLAGEILLGGAIYGVGAVLFFRSKLWELAELASARIHRGTVQASMSQ